MTRIMHRGEEKRRFIRRMFGEIAHHYDFLNRLLSLRMDVRWRRRLAGSIKVQPGDRILDLACGTGDVARHIGQRQPECLVVGADPVPGMLSKARNKFPPLIPVCCESENLPFPDNIFQAVTVAFGVRNFSYLKEGLQEIYRVMTAGGRLGILEFALPEKGPLRGFYRWYLTTLLPGLGALFSRGYAYRYLPDSIYNFPAPGEFMELLATAGFSRIITEQFLGGVVWTYCGWKR
ncbi:MAG: ubiquinone/menaquinone biosynthesis methyltransferase [Candidatus Neomarinimicrobiota bacterium]